MKKITLKILVLATIFACATGASIAQKSVKETLKEAKEILKKAGITTITAPPEEPLEKCSYIFLSRGAQLRRIDNIHSEGRGLASENKLGEIRAIPAGNHVLYVHYDNAGKYSYTTSIAFNFEEGKYYRLYNENTTEGKGFSKREYVHFLIEDLTDPELIKKVQTFEAKYKACIPTEKNRYRANLKNANESLKIFKEDENIKAYLAYMQANPNRLDGIWEKESKFLGVKYSMQYTINGGKIRSEVVDSKNGIFETEARLLYNENTFAFVGGKRYDNGHEDKSFINKRIIPVSYYTINNDVLHFENSEGKFELNKREESNNINATPDSASMSEESVIGWDLIPEENVSDNESMSENAATGREFDWIAWGIKKDTLIISGEGDIPGTSSIEWAVNNSIITSAVIEDGITGIGHHAFSMSKIKTITIGKDVANIDTYAFFNCKNLVSVKIKNKTPPKLGSFVFMQTSIGKAKLIVPAGTKAVYENDKSWKNFGTIEESDE